MYQTLLRLYMHVFYIMPNSKHLRNAHCIIHPNTPESPDIVD